MGKKSFASLALATTVGLAVLATACGGGSAPAPTQAPSKPAATSAPAATAPASATKPAGTSAPAASGAPALTKEYKLSMATGGTAGTYYPYGGAIAGLWSKNLKGVNVTAETTGAAVENQRLLGNKQVELALTQNDVADYAMNGTEMFKEKITNFRAVAALYPEVLQWVVTPNIKTISDLKGKKFVVGAAASGTEANSRQVLETLGMSYKDLGKAAFLSYAEAASAMKDRQMDGFAVTGGVPTSAITDVTTAQEISLLPISGDDAKKVMDKYKFFVPVKVPASAYKGLTGEVQTIAVQSMLVARDDLDADLVYWLTKTLIEKQADLAQSHAKGKDLSKESAVKGLTVPLQGTLCFPLVCEFFH
ncbi:MAG TPA: TAXI family TRAP transporter solute-binding subunit [Chloroflexota bacterium]|nr:TAXI family TRAP transporter solute-binding subunit [Chloroflexota bacterium]